MLRRVRIEVWVNAKIGVRVRECLQKGQSYMYDAAYEGRGQLTKHMGRAGVGTS